MAEQLGDGVSQDLEGGGQERNGRARHAAAGLQEDEEDMEGGLDEDWGQDVDIIELQNSCLLYTSPSPRDGLLSRMPSSA